MSLNDELLTAAAAGDYNKVRNLVDKGADINISDNHKQSPLHYASYSGYLDITKYLLDKGADVKVKDKDGNTPLHNAIRSDNYKLAVIECLIKKGADSNARDNNGNTPLHIAARFSTLEVVKYLIGQGADMMAKGSMNHTPLHFAVLNSNLEIVQYFLEKGADVNVADNSGLTSLHLAAGHSSNLEIVRSLIKRNADVSAKDNKGRTPLDIAKTECSNCKDIIDLLKEKSTSSVRHDVQNTTDDKLFSAVKARDYTAVKTLIDNGANVNAKNGSGDSILHFAISFCFSNANIVRYLVEKGANVSVTDNIGRTPLHLAAGFLNNIDIVEYLIKDKHVNVNAKDNNGRTPLHNTTESSIIEMVKYLVEKGGADVNVKDNQGHAPLHLAARYASSEVSQYLAKGEYADVNGTSSNEYDFLCNADPMFGNAYVFSPKLQMIKLFIGKGADVSAQDKQGKTPLTLAKETCLGTGCAGNSTSRVRRDVQYTTEFINPETSFDWIQGKVTNVLTTEATNSSNLLQVDLNSTMSLLDVIIRKFTGQKLVPTATDTGLSEKQRLGYTLSINDNFEKAVRYAAKESGIPIRSLDVDFFKVFEEIYTNIDSGKFYQIPEVLSSYAKKACIDEQIGTQKCNKFIDAFEKKLSIENILIMLTSYREAGDISDHIIQSGVFNLGNENSPQNRLENVSISSGNITQAKAQDLSRRG